MSPLPSDVDCLRWVEDPQPTAGVDQPVRSPKRSQQQKFLKGPIPLPWLSKAADLPGKALALGLTLWYLWGLNRGKPFKLTGSALGSFKVGRKAAYKGLELLEQAGLIDVQRRTGARPIVTINDITCQ